MRTDVTPGLTQPRRTQLLRLLPLFLHLPDPELPSDRQGRLEHLDARILHGVPIMRRSHGEEEHAHLVVVGADRALESLTQELPVMIGFRSVRF